jgi:hypothetical protein
MLRRDLDRAKQNAARLEDEAAAARRREIAAKGQLTKHRKRSAAGTCPCCNRTFANMGRHMKTKHPEFVEEQGGKVVPIKAKSA